MGYLGGRQAFRVAGLRTNLRPGAMMPMGPTASIGLRLFARSLCNFGG